jgi:hypothetical protein
MIAIGKQVIVRPLFGTEKYRGTVTSICDVYQSGMRDTQYGVKLESGELQYYTSIEVYEADLPQCTCGADKAYEPAPPPGHAYYCDSLKLPDPDPYENDVWY